MAFVVSAAVVAGMATYESHGGPPDEENPSRASRVTYFVLGGFFLADVLALLGLGFAFSSRPSDQDPTTDA
ncbi:MAG: hypothetical protein IT303_13230 [Dehalococcoidia bacterium]|nr:hypothetical protein [Dehalococcoidia bacterium]